MLKIDKFKLHDGLPRQILNKKLSARGRRKKTSHKEKGPKMPDLQALLPQNLPVVTIRHQNPLYTSVIVGKQTLKNIYFSEPRAFDIEFVLRLKYINF